MFYEITLITPENNTAEDMAGIRSTIEKWADIHTAEDEGVKRLAYAIPSNGVEHNYGHYLFYTATLNNGDYEQLSAELRQDNKVLRHLIVKADRKYIKH